MRISANAREARVLGGTLPPKVVDCAPVRRQSVRRVDMLNELPEQIAITWISRISEHDRVPHHRYTSAFLAKRIQRIGYLSQRFVRSQTHVAAQRYVH